MVHTTFVRWEMVSRAIFEVEAMLERFSRVKRMLKTMRPVSIFSFEVLATFWTVFANFLGKTLISPDFYAMSVYIYVF